MFVLTFIGPLAGVGSIPNTIAFVKSPLENKRTGPDLHIYHHQRIKKEIELSGSYDGISPSYFPGPYYDSFAVTPRLISVKSRGTVRLNNTDPIWSHPKIKLNLLSDPHDLKTIVKGAQIASRLFETQLFKKMGIKKYTKPIKACEQYGIETSKYFECAAKKYSEPVWHVTGTCRMGPKNDSTAVVDPKLRVYGIEGLRVIDASIMPNIPSGNTYSPTIMIAEKGSDFIKSKWL